MDLKGKKVGFCFTGSFCTFKSTIEQLKVLVKAGADILPVMSNHAYELDTKFREGKRFYSRN